MTKDYSSAHIDGAEDLFGFIRDSNLDVNTEEERYVTNIVCKFSYGFFIVMLATIYPDKSKNYLIIAEKNKNGQH